MRLNFSFSAAALLFGFFGGIIQSNANEIENLLKQTLNITNKDSNIKKGDEDKIQKIDFKPTGAELKVVNSALEKNIGEIESAATPLKKMTTQFERFSSVRVEMQRMLRSRDGKYFLDLHAGVWNPHAKLTMLKQDKTIPFQGFQKGDHLTMSSVASSSCPDSLDQQYRLRGTLNANTGELNVTLSRKSELGTEEISFEPVIKIQDKPIFIFRFYGMTDPNTKKSYIEKIEVIDKSNKNIFQQLLGFKAFDQVVAYKDVNFDGYYDLILADASQNRRLKDKRYIYWVYNPKLQQFQRSADMEKIHGTPSLDGIKKQIKFESDQVVKVMMDNSKCKM